LRRHEAAGWQARLMQNLPSQTVSGKMRKEQHMRTQSQRIRLRPAFEALIRGLAAWLLVGSAGLAAAAPPPTSEHYATSTYREKTPRLTAMVDAWPASLRAESAYIPLQV